MWNIFISHASEDKDTIARPLAGALREKGFRVWFDEQSLRLGDRLRSSIDEGLSKSDYGVVILSKNFFAKKWPQRELDGLFARESNGTKVILPVWHGVSEQEVAHWSPMLADRLAADTSLGLPRVVEQIVAVLGSPSNVVSIPPTLVLELFEGAIRAYQADRIDGVNDLPSGPRERFEASLGTQERAMRLLTRVQDAKQLSAADKRLISTAFLRDIDRDLLRLAKSAFANNSALTNPQRDIIQDLKPPDAAFVRSAPAFRRLKALPGALGRLAQELEEMMLDRHAMLLAGYADITLSLERTPFSAAVVTQLLLLTNGFPEQAARMFAPDSLSVRYGSIGLANIDMSISLKTRSLTKALAEAGEEPTNYGLQEGDEDAQEMMVRMAQMTMVTRATTTALRVFREIASVGAATK